MIETGALKRAWQKQFLLMKESGNSPELPEERREVMRTILAIGLVSLLVSTSAFGGANSGVAKVAVHVVDHSSRSCSKNMPTITSCEDIITTNAGYNVDFFPVFFDLVEYQGIEYGVTWNGSSCTFTSCSDLTIGDIVNAGDGVSHAWSECQSGPVAIPGFGWIYSYGSICIVPHPAAGGPNIGDCAAPDRSTKSKARQPS